MRNFKYLDSDLDRALNIIRFVDRGMDYSFLLTRTEKQSISRAWNQYQTLVGQNHGELTLIQQAKIVTGHFQITIEEDSSVLPEILFLGDELVFENKIWSLVEKDLVNELIRSYN